MAERRDTWSAVRWSAGHQAKRLGWCAHRHRTEDTARACARRLNVAWESTGERWYVMMNGHIFRPPGAQTGSTGGTGAGHAPSLPHPLWISVHGESAEGPSAGPEPFPRRWALARAPEPAHAGLRPPQAPSEPDPPVSALI